MLQEIWQENRAALGTMIIAMRNPAIAQIMAAAGFDFLVIDCEHGSFSYETVESIITTARGVGITPIVRIPEIRREPVLKVLEAGAGGILAPQIEQRADAEALVSFMRYAPVGTRGVSLTRPHTGFRKVSSRTYMDEANQRNLLILQIETRTALQNLDAMLSVPGVDVALVGPNDLSQSLTNGRNDNPEALNAAIDQVMLSATKHGVQTGIHCSRLEDVEKWLHKGMRMCMWSSDVGLILDQARQGLKVLRALEK